MISLLVTGFAAFADVAINPTQLIVDTIKAQGRSGVTATVLPVSYQAAATQLLNLIAIQQPQVVVCLGVARRRYAITPERFALNINDATLPDNEGDHAQGRLIVPDAPLAYSSTLPLMEMQAALAAAKIPVEISNHAGTYVCNHIFYTLCHAMAQGASPRMGGFIHVPALALEDADEGLPLDMIQRGIELCLDVCLAKVSIPT